MNSHRFTYGELIIQQDDIVEVIADDGIEIDLAMIGEFHEFLINNMQAPFALLINKRNSYSFTLEAQKYLYALEQINAVAVVAHNKASEDTAQALLDYPGNPDFEGKVFDNREDALNWLKNKQNQGDG
ncbi:hypothetical protein R50073_09560 [Maricurvus nonylphenolicus]|uniref:DUF7793 family protein n=1 Tax=Maricurvus nonylphenolicus TaxID=1008307 RepID=UPI0036F1D39C